MSEKVYLLKLDAPDMAIVGASIALMGVTTQEMDGKEIVRATYDEVLFQLKAQGLDVHEELAKQQHLHEKRKSKR